MLLAAIIVGGVFALSSGGFSKKYEANLSTLAQCLTDKGAKFYGAYWCPHCAAQKQAFGKAVKQLPYVECAEVGNQQGQSPACAAVTPKIESYPTWIFADGTRMTGEIALTKLAEKTGCPFIPEAGEDGITVDMGGSSNAVKK